MKRILIFCEGVTDQIFISDCLEMLYGIPCQRIPKKVRSQNVEVTFNGNSEIIDVGGCSKLTDPIYISLMEDNSELGGINIIIFDADAPGAIKTKPGKIGNNGFSNCMTKLNALKTNKNLSFDFYIWPNHSQDGMIEDLLRQLIPSEKKPILNCIESHKNCLQSLAIENLKYAEIKEQIGFYLYTLQQASESRKRNYKDSSFWNLDFEAIEDLKKLKLFLDRHFRSN